LSVLSINSSPGDQIEHGLTCEPELGGDTCTVVKGLMSIMAHQGDDLDIIIGSILDATEDAMDEGILIAPADEDRIFGVTFLGETLEEADEALNGGATGDGGSDRGGVIDGSEQSPANEDSSDDGSGIVTVFAVGVPLLALLGLAFFVSKKNRNVATTAPKPYYVITGTGDPPRSFHEGLYHYTRGGARYLSTNCMHCYETRRNGFLTLDGANSQDDGGLVSPSSKDLGGRHSGMDVHECTSATCNICKFRADELVFAGSPRKQGQEPIPEESSADEDEDEDDVSEITDANTNAGESKMTEVSMV
jgi:hypothetical protein